jgi:hypothetical protein
MGIIGFGAFQRGGKKMFAERGECKPFLSGLPRKIGVESELEIEL